MERDLVLVLIALIGTALAGPLQRQDTCSTTCTDSNKFQFRTGKTYQYAYESEIKTLIQGASEDHASLHMTADVDLEIISKCELSMNLRNVRLSEYDPNESLMMDASTEFRTYLQRHPIRVSYQDGTISDVCLTADEPAWVVNVKRGIVSLIQNNMDDLQSNRNVTETDVAGVCHTEYYLKDDGWYSTTVGKSKNLLGCTERNGQTFAVQSVPYTAESGIQSLPVLKSDHNCEHTFDKQTGALRSATCTEKHVFRPFSSEENGAITTNKQTLTYVAMTSGIRSTDPITTRVSLKFDHEVTSTSENQNRKDITDKLKEICDGTKTGVRSETPKLFTDLVYLMKRADSSILGSIHKMLTEQAFCPDNLYRTRQFFLDALPMTGTAGSLELMTQLMTSGTVTGVEAVMWLKTLAFIKKPSIEMLVAVKPLMNMQQTKETAMLSVGSLVYSYCRNRDNCENDSTVKAILTVYRTQMARNCKVNADNIKATLMALRGIGNAGYATDMIPDLDTCLLADTNPVEIRLSAIEAFRRMPCGSSRSGLVKLLQDIENDSELRIAAYKVLMECPSQSVLNTVRSVLDAEPVNQVGSYIWTHLTNLMETSDRHKQDIRSLLEDVKFQKEFDLDKRKFSRNYEGSVFLDALNAGAKAEGDLIWSQKSFVPRSAAVNLTVDLFGHSINLLDFGGRVEGLDNVLEHFFGPNGYFSKYTATEGKPTESDLSIEGVKMDKLSKINRRMSSTVSKLSGSLYMRVFGNELHYMSFSSLEDLMSSQFNALEMLINLAENNDYTYTHSSLFLDGSYIVPTSSGFPLNLTVNGTATVDLRLKGKMDLRSPPTVDIDGLIQPSAAIAISSIMSVDAFVTKSGVKMASTLHTSTAVEGKISVDKSGSITAEYDMPQDKMSLIDVQSSFFTLHRDMEKEQRMIEENRQTVKACSSDKLVTLIGVQMCTEASYPNASRKIDSPYFPLTGPVSAGVYIYKRDTHSKYHFSVKSVHNAYKNNIFLSVDTPGSKVDRQLKLDINVDKKDLGLDISVVSPWRKAFLHGSVTNAKKLLAVSGDINVDGLKPYSFKAQLPTEVNGNMYTYSPSLEVLSNKRSLYELKGVCSVKGLRQLDVQLSASGFTSKPLSTTLTIQNNPKLMGLKGIFSMEEGKDYSVESNMVVQGYKKKGIYKPFVSIRTPTEEKLAFGGSVSVIYGKKVDLNLVLDKIVEKSVVLKGLVQKLEKRRGRVIYKTNGAFKSSPADFELKSKIDNRNWRSVATDIEFVYIIRRVARNSIKFLSKVFDMSTSTLTKGKTNMNLEVKRNPEYNMKMVGEANHNRKHTSLDLNIMYGPDFSDDSKRIDMMLESNHLISNYMPRDVDLSTRIRFPALGIASQVRGDYHFDNKNLTSNMMMKFGKGQPLTGKIELLDQSADYMKYATNFDLSYPGSDVSIHHTITEGRNGKNEKYISMLNAQLQKRQTNNVETSIERADDRLIISSDVSLHNENPFNIQAQLGLSDRNIITRLECNRDTNTAEPKKYAAFVEGAYSSEDAHISVGFDKPDLGTGLTLKGKLLSEVVSFESGLQFRNGSDKPQTYSATVWYKPSDNNVNGSVTISYPSRTIILNAHHHLGSKYITHADLQWAPDRSIDIDTSFQLEGEKVIGSAIVKTPLLPTEVKVTLTHDSNTEEYKTLLDIAWDETLTIDSVIKKPLSLKTLVATIDASSSIKAIRKLNLFVNHKMKSSIDSEVKFSWNKQFYFADFSASNKSKGSGTSLTGTLDIKTSNKFMKKGVITFTHINDGQTFNTDLSFLRNQKEYRLDSKIVHMPKQYRMINNGEITITLPNSRIATTWDHEHSDRRLSSSLSSSWDKDTVSVKVGGDFRNGIDTEFAIHLPLTSGVASLDEMFVLRNGNLSGMLNLKVNKNYLAKAAIGYSTESNFTSHVVLEVPDLGVNSKMSLDAYEARAVMGVNFKADITPEISMNLDLRQQYSFSNQLSLSTITWTSTIPGHELFRYSYEVIDSDQNELTTVATIQYTPNKEIKLQTKLLIDIYEKYELSADLTTPFESLPRMQGGINMVGNRAKFTANGYLDIQPYFDQISATVKWNTDNRIEGTVTIAVPKQRDIIITFTHEGPLRDFSTHAEIQHNRKNNFLADLKLSLTNRAFISAKTSIRTTVIPIIDDTDFSVSAEASTGRFETDGQFSYSSLGKSSILVLLDTNNAVVARFDLISPLMKNIRSSFSLSTQNNFYESRADLVFGGDSIISGLTTLTKDPTSFVGELKLKTFATEDLSLVSRSNGKVSDFVSNSEVSYGQKKAQVEIMSKNSDSLFHEIVTFRATGLEDMSYEVKLAGNAENFVSFLELNNGSQKHRLDVSFNNNAKLENVSGNLRLSSPLVEPCTLSFSVAGSLKNFRSHAELTFAGNKSEADFDFALSPLILLTFDVKSQYFPHISGSLSHTGSFANMNSNIVFSMPEMDDLDIKMQMTSTLFSVKMASPFDQLSDFETSLSFSQQQGNLDTSVKCKMTTARKTTSFLDMSFQLAETTLKTQLTMDCPAIPTIAVSFLHEGDLNSFKCHAEYSVDSEQSVADFSFNSLNGVQSTLTVTSPNFEPVMLNFIVSLNESQQKGFTFVGTLDLANDKSRVEFTLDDSTSNAQCSLLIDTPYYPEIRSKLTLGVTENLNINSDLFVDGKKHGSLSVVSGDKVQYMFVNIPKTLSVSMVNGEDHNLQFKYDLEKMLLDLSLTSTKPHLLRIVYFVSASLPDIRCNWEFTHNTDAPLTGDIQYKIVSEPLLISGQASVAAENFNGFMKTTINPAESNYESSTVLRLTENTWAFEGSAKTKGSIEGSFKIAIPDRDEISGLLTHKRRSIRSESHAEFTWNSTNKYEADLALNWRKGIDALLSLSTPIEGYEKSEVKFVHTGSLPNIDSTLTMKYGSKLIQSEVANSIDGMSVKSKVLFTSPYTDRLYFSQEYTGDLDDFTNMWEVAIGDDNRITSNTTFKVASNSLVLSSAMTTVANRETFTQLAELKHNGNIKQFKTELLLKAQEKTTAVDVSFQQEPVVEGKISLLTPFKNMEDMKLSFSHSGSSHNILTTAKVQYAPGKEVGGEVNFIHSGVWLETRVEINTPFKNFETNTLTYTHTGEKGRIQCNADLSVMKKNIKGTLSASVTPLSLSLNIDTPFENFEAIGLKGNLVTDKTGYSAHFQTGWNPSSQIILDSSLSLSSLDGRISISTPFTQLQSASAEVFHNRMDKGYRSGLAVTYNRESMLDGSADYNLIGDHKNAVIKFLAPRPMVFSIDGDFTVKCVDFDLDLNWNEKRSDSSIKLEAGYDVRFVEKTMKVKLSNPDMLWSINGIFHDRRNKLDIVWGKNPAEKAGYDVTLTSDGVSAKLTLPSRTLALTFAQRGRIVDGSFLWNADEDVSKKIDFRSEVISNSRSLNADVTITMPKDIKLGSVVKVNVDRVLFEGRTELTYSRDSRKNIVFSTKLEDVSQADTTNYSLSVGVSQPYTTLDVQVKSHVSSSQAGYSADIDLDYLTTQRQIKTFKMGGKIDKIRKTVNFELQSPLKTVSISGSVQTDRQFTASLRNVYDQKQPLNTVFTFDESRRSVDFFINYDLDNPDNEFHINAKYVNSTAVQAEMYHVTNRARITDALVTARLNNTHLFHSRLHWRPEIMQDLQAFLDQERADYRVRVARAKARAKQALVEEILQKLSKIIGEMGEEIGRDYVEQVERETVRPVLEKVLRDYVPLPDQEDSPFSARTFRSKLVSIPAQSADVLLQNETSYMATLRSQISDKFNFVSEKVSLPSRHIPQAVTRVVGRTADFVGQVLPKPAYTQIEIMVRDWKLAEYLEFLLKSLLEKEEENVREVLQRIENTILSHMQSPFTVYDPEHGEIQLEKHLLFPVYSLDVFPVVHYVEYMEKLKNMVPTELPDMPSLDVDLIPPFTGVASISKGQRVTTFDGYIYDLDSDCTYMLTQDFMNQNFTVLLSNDDDRTLTVVSAGTIVSINMQEQVLIGDRPATLPVTAGNMVVSEDTNGIVTISNNDHFTILYDTNIDHISIKVNGWYYGKTAGLFGVHDNEPSNDLMTSFGKTLDNVDRFAKTWEVGTSSCR